MSAEPATPTGCVHSKYARGCPACAYRLLKHYGIVKPSRVFDHYSGLNRWNPDVGRLLINRTEEP